MHVVSSITMTPPEPAMEPAAMRESKSMRTSIWSAVRTFAEMPPGITALSFRPPRTPWAWFSMSSRSVTPTGAS